MILIPFTREIPETTSIAILGFPHVLAEVGRSDTAYWELLRDWWVSDEHDILVIEHDIVADASSIKALYACPESWCAAWYPFEGNEIWGLGFTKFGLSIRRAVPDAIEREGKMEEPGKHPRMHWCSLDAWLQAILRAEGQVPHVHRLPIGHTNKRRSHLACR